MTGYDVIGDIHGHATELEALLKAMGYTQQHGTWRHGDRQAIFVGDFIDRGPEQLRSVDIVRRMVDAGHAQAVMGNHEFNAIAWHRHDEQGHPLREHSEKNRNQHSAFLAEVTEGSAKHNDIIEWFLSLPLWLELDGINIIHACWHQPYMDRFAQRLTRGHRLSDELMHEAARNPAEITDTTLFHAIEAWLKGMEIPLPKGMFFNDKDGHARDQARLKWWAPDASRFIDGIVAPKDGELHRILGEAPFPEDARFQYPHDNPVFFGHYWMSGKPAITNPRAICVDYSVARKGKLVAYRWNGDETPSSNKLFSI